MNKRNLVGRRPGTHPKTGGRQKGSLNKATVIAREVLARQRATRKPVSPEAARARLDDYYRRLYGIGVADYEALLGTQGGRCAACGSENPGAVGGRFRVDYDRNRGLIRGLVCLRCSTILGYLEKQGPRLNAVREYLQQHRAADVGLDHDGRQAECKSGNVTQRHT